MDDDELVAHVRKQLGVPPPGVYVTVPLPVLLQFVACSYRSLGTSTGWALMLGDTGRPLLRELDRSERQMNYHLGDLFR
jgi:hypothetical protein